jgi:hypothetical protein
MERQIYLFTYLSQIYRISTEMKLKTKSGVNSYIPRKYLQGAEALYSLPDAIYRPRKALPENLILNLSQPVLRGYVRVHTLYLHGFLLINILHFRS